MAKISRTCGRCFQPTLATTEETLTFGTSTYQMALCDPHADAFRRDMFAWARCGSPVDEAPTRRREPVEGSFGGQVLASYVHVPIARTPQQMPETKRIKPQAPPPRMIHVSEPEEPEEYPEHNPKLPKDHHEWTFSKHALSRHVEREISGEEIFWCASHPEDRWRSEKDSNLWVHRRGQVQLVLNPVTKEIVTVVKKTNYSVNGKELVQHGV